MRLRVWYAAFGSNLDQARLMRYLRGGRPVGATHETPPCDDRRPPAAWFSTLVPGRLHFGENAGVWGGGGVAFLSTAPTPRHSAWVRAWQISFEQFRHVAQWENRMQAAPEIPFGNLDDLVEGGDVELPGDGWYRRIVRLGTEAGLPVLTLTHAHDVVPRAPRHAYLQTMARGLAQTRQADDAEWIVDYLFGCAPVADAYTRDDLRWLL